MASQTFQDLYELGTNLYTDLKHLGVTAAVILALDYIVPLPTDYNNGTAPGFDLALAGGIVRRRGGSVAAALLSISPEVLSVFRDGDVGALTTRALSKVAVYGLSSLAADNISRLYHRVTNKKIK